jgi:hypothetical protein
MRAELDCAAEDTDDPGEGGTAKRADEMRMMVERGSAHEDSKRPCEWGD